MSELERGLSEFVLDCTACGMKVHWVQGISVSELLVDYEEDRTLPAVLVEVGGRHLTGPRERSPIP